MTVKKLIEELKKYPEDIEVYIDANSALSIADKINTIYTTTLKSFYHKKI